MHPIIDVHLQCTVLVLMPQKEVEQVTDIHRIALLLPHFTFDV